MDIFDKIPMVNSWTGLVHTILALVAMISGTWVLLRKKGTKWHKQMGYVYVVSMLLMLVTSFGLYNFGGPSLFHFFSIVSLTGIGLGIIPAIRRTNKNWYVKHFHFMSWSVVGLYCAFWAEIGTRMVDMRYFWWMVMLATMLTAGIGGVIIRRTARSLKMY